MSINQDVNPEEDLPVAVKAEMAWTDLAKVTESYSILITDPIAQAAVKGRCSWYDFCMYRIKNAERLRKSFITTYVNLSKTGIHVEPRILLSYGDNMSHKIDWNRFRIIGNQEKGKMMIRRAIENTFKPYGAEIASVEPQSLGAEIADTMTQLPGGVQ
ncbi:MAG TPA: hypothetical protein PLM53_20360 [Spirochaetota bacterium]|nr:hypothetical protein [Spirochaetota bacterium]HQH99449.1 hypothetical protein [Spirochaetota bacterium]